MKKIPIEWSDLELAFDNSFWEISYYLDKETGQTLMVTGETRQELERIYEAYFDPDAPNEFDLEAALAQSHLPDWQQEAVREADLVERDYGSRIIEIPRAESHEAYNDMQDFIVTIEDACLQNQLLKATHGHGAFGRFRDILGRH